jgi:2-keto-3-deoxy-L-fuconate dehydrogenase
MTLLSTHNTALVTGAASGIGRAVAHALANQGVKRLILVDRDATRLDQLAREMPETQTVLAVGDVADADFWARTQALLVDLDMAVINAGVSGASTITETDFDEWRRILSINLDGAFLSLQAAMRAMTKAVEPKGSIVFTASASGLKAEVGTAAYGASKAGLLQLMRVAAKEGAAQGIRVNAIAPAGVETAMWSGTAYFRDRVSALGSEAAVYAEIAAAGTPLGRFATADEIAAQICFLLSPAAATITGATLSSDGGYLL